MQQTICYEKKTTCIIVRKPCVAISVATYMPYTYYQHHLGAPTLISYATLCSLCTCYLYLLYIFSFKCALVQTVRFCFVHLLYHTAKMSSQKPSLRERIGDSRNLRGRQQKTDDHKNLSDGLEKPSDGSKNLRTSDQPRDRSPSIEIYHSPRLGATEQLSVSQGQALPATNVDSTSRPPFDSKSVFATSTDGFVLTSEFTMHQAKELATLLAIHKKNHLDWRIVLNNTTSTRPKAKEGPTCKPIRDLFICQTVSSLKTNPSPLFSKKNCSSDDNNLNLATDDVSGSAKTHEVIESIQARSDTWFCAILDMPNSFTMDDQLGFKVAAVADSEGQASETACFLAFTHLMLRDSNKVILHPKHWNVDVSTIRQEAMSISGIQSPATGSDIIGAPAPPSRSQKAQSHYEAPLAGDEPARNEQICEILTQMINESDSGWVDPRCAKRWQLLRRMVPAGTLEAFIRARPQFQIWRDEHQAWFFGLAR